MAVQVMLEEEGATSFDFAATQADAVRSALAHHPNPIASDVKLIKGTGPRAAAKIYPN